MGGRTLDAGGVDGRTLDAGGVDGVVKVGCGAKVEWLVRSLFSVRLFFVGCGVAFFQC